MAKYPTPENFSSRRPQPVVGSTPSQSVGAGKVVGGITAMIGAILVAVFGIEGGYVDHPSDPGGATNHGVTEQVARDNGYAGPMDLLPRETAEQIYVANYIEKPGYMPLIELDPRVAEEVIDSAVNAGPGRASRWLQQSLNHFNGRGRDYPDITEDGQVGPGTIAAVRALQKRRGKVLACQLLIKALDAKQAAHYFALAGRNTRFEDFSVGWMIRVGNVDWHDCGKPFAVAP